MLNIVGEGSSSYGVIIKDTLSLDNDVKLGQVTFGCELMESGLIKKQKVDGIIGLGNSSSSIVT